MTDQPTTKPSFKTRFFNIISVPALIGIVLGAAGGYVYYVRIGCLSGTCPLTSNPYMSVIWGAAIGYLLGDLFTKKKKPVPQDAEKEQM
jgi:hypothetical protein